MIFGFKTEKIKYLHIPALKRKLNESISSALPIIIIVLLLSFLVTPIPASVLLAFIFGAVMMIFGTMFFGLGADLAMDVIGKSMGSSIMKTKKLGLILFVSFVLGFMITVSEPDLVVLADQITSIPSRTLILATSAGVGLFLAAALIRIIFAFKLRTVLLICYGLVFVVFAFAPKDFLAVAFDAGGISTGPMTVPFIMAYGVGISSMRSDKNAQSDSFGVVSLASAGAIFAVLILSIIYNPQDATYSETLAPVIEDSMELADFFISHIPSTFVEIFKALLPITAFFSFFQVALLKLDSQSIVKIFVGLLYTFFGLVIFLTGVNFGFIPTGSYLGSALASLENNWILVPIGMLLGFFIVKAEPAVAVLTNQVEEQTNGVIQGRLLSSALSIGVSLSVGLSMVRVLTGLSVFVPLLIGYAIIFALSFAVPPVFVGIAFDSGGVAAGPMTATFLLPMAMGACIAVGGNVVTDAFGIVAMISMTPLIVIQILGLIYKRENAGSRKDVSVVSDELVIIEL